ncbi:MAG: ATP-binding protein [Treponema sp.]|nr:ATP-binding protein [Treponema sp.]
MKEFKVAAEDQSMDSVNEFIHSFLPEDCNFGILNKIDLAVEEIFVNIAHYAYSPEKGFAWIQGDFSDNTLTVIFKDQGKAFNPLAKKDPDITLSAEERNIGGLGIFLTKKFMDSVDYEYRDGYNILSIKKNIG